MTSAAGNYGRRLDGTPVRVEPGKAVVVSELPACDICKHLNGTTRTAEYDFATVMGPWANGCEEHFQTFSASGLLGVGMGQVLIARATLELEPA